MNLNHSFLDEDIELLNNFSNMYDLNNLYNGTLPPQANSSLPMPMCKLEQLMVSYLFFCINFRRVYCSQSLQLIPSNILELI